jgi:Flp pilus assembly protein TadG
MALLVPALLALLGLAVATGRYESAASAVEGASAAAARAASLARTPGQAHRDATGIATTALTGQSPSCRDLAVSVDTSGFQTPATGVIQTGTPALVAVTVTCQIDLGDLGVPGLPGTKTISSRTVSVLDTFRAIT